MKLISYICLLMMFTVFFSCKKDNYSAPGSELTGALMYNGDSINVEYNRVPFQLYQYGFGKVGAINETFDQSGIMHALLFDGDYKFIIPNGQGPFLWKQINAGDPDTLDIAVNGNTNVNIEVTPYYMIRNAQISGSGSNVTATFKLEQIITGPNAKDVENVTLFINKTQFVSGADNIRSSGMPGSAITDPNNVTLTVAIPAITPTQNYVFARIGLKIAGIEDLIFSPLKKISF
ncbi:MAG: DUF3823 domain-containing protein [Ginsengibacter sp.]